MLQKLSAFHPMERHFILCDVHDNFKYLSGNTAPIGSGSNAAQSQYGTAVATGGNVLTASDEASIYYAPSMVDPGALEAFKTMANDGAYVAGMAIQESSAAQGAAAAIVASALKGAQAMSKTPIQELTPLLLVGAAIILGGMYLMTGGRH